MKRHLYAVLAFSIALAVRLYPTFSSGLPFSTDAWSPIRNAELLMEYTPVNLDSKVFDGYNCYWPANSLFGAVFSLLTGLKPMAAMAFGIPLAGALAILIFYALVSRICRGPELAFFSSIFLATAYPYALFTAGVTKETYANPLYMLSILIFLSQGRWRKTLLFAVASSALVMAHHLTALVSIAVLASIALATQVRRVGEGLSLEKSNLIHVSILTAVAALYFGLYAYRGLKLTLTLSDWLSASSYQILALAIALAMAPYFTSKRHTDSDVRRVLAALALAAVALASSIALLCTKRSIVPGAPRLPSHYLLYASPFILMAPLTALGLGELREMRGEHQAAPLFWLAAILGLEGYAVFGDSPLGLTLAYRTLNFLCPPLAILCAAGLYRSYLTAKAHTYARKSMRLAAVAVLLLISTLSSYSVYAAVSMQERYMGYFWLYRVPEYEAAEWLAATANQTVAGDVKAYYLLKDYFNVEVDTHQGLKYLAGKGAKPQTLLVYDQMLRNGYVTYGGYSVDLPEGWTEKLYNLSILYSNSLVKVYGG